MVGENFPSATFGKPEGASAYQVIAQHATFESPAVARAFRKIYTGFEWRALPADSPHPPCHGIQRVDASRLLIAEFRDVGRDSAGRPHTLRIDCLLVEAEEFPTAWRQAAGKESPAQLPAGDHLVITGNPDTYSSATG